MKNTNNIDLSSVNKKRPIQKKYWFKNPLRGQSGQRRDNQGKFTTGTGGLSFTKRLKWDRVLPLVLVVALTGGYLVFRSFAAGVRPQGVYSNWSWNTPAEGFTNLSHQLTIEEVTENAPYFWSNQFNFVGGDGGYMGLQSNGSRVNGTTGKTAVFSIFNAAVDATSGSCSIERGSFDGASGSGTSCRIPYEWQTGIKYQFRIEKGATESNGTWWSSWVTNTATNQETFIARIKVPPAWRGMGDWSVQWTEYFGAPPITCDQLARSKVRFYQPSRTYNGQNVAPARSWLHYATGADCTNSNITTFDGGTIQEMGPASNATVKMGLQATYYTGTTLKGNFVSRVDPNLSFIWNTAPVTGINSTTFSARWTGKLIAPESGTYTINMAANDTGTLWLDGKPLLDTRGLTAGSGKSTQVSLEAGKSYDVDFDLYNTSGSAVASLSWKTPSATGIVQIPQTAFRTSKQAGLSARYSNRGSIVKYYGLKNEPTIDHSWGTASPASGVTADSFRVNWLGKLKVPTTGTYKLISVSNDGVQLVLNNKLLINDWTDGPTRRREVSVKLETGKEYAISFNYYDNTGDATARLLWSGPGITETVIPASALTIN